MGGSFGTEPGSGRGGTQGRSGGMVQEGGHGVGAAVQAGGPGKGPECDAQRLALDSTGSSESLDQTDMQLGQPLEAREARRRPRAQWGVAGATRTHEDYKTTFCPPGGSSEDVQTVCKGLAEHRAWAQRLACFALNGVPSVPPSLQGP